VPRRRGTNRTRDSATSGHGAWPRARSGLDTKSIERSHVPTKDRLRPMRGLQSIRTGQRVVEGVELARAVRRGHVAAPDAGAAGRSGPHMRARAAATTFMWLADGLCIAA